MDADPGVNTRVYLRVTGRVQNVGYRFFVRGVARRLQLAGWVRNRADTSVEAQLEGADEAVDAALAALREGPRLARVSTVQVLQPEPIPAPSSPPTFSIRNTT